MFEYEREANLLRIHDELIHMTYQLGAYRTFIVKEPKERLISALPFRDRVVQHAIYNVLNPLFDKSFAYDSYACRLGKGSLKAGNRISYFMNKPDCKWYLYCDISKYFSSIDKDVLKSILKRNINDSNVLTLLYRVIDSSHKGMPIGNLLSQMFANIYLNELDHFVAQNCHPTGYSRYMDDFVLLFPTKHEARLARELVYKYTHKSLKIRLNKKTAIGKLRDGITFCGYVIKEHDRRVKYKTIQRMLRKERAWEKGKITDEAFLDSVGSASGHCKGTSSYESVCKILLKALRHAILEK